MLDSANLFHVGMVAPSLEEAIRDLSALGHEFLPVIETERQVRVPGAILDVRFRVAYSRGPLHLELIETSAGSIWADGDVGRFHHLGYWSDDIERDSRALAEAGMPLAARADAWVYHDSGKGYFIELLDSAVRPAFLERFENASPSAAKK